MSEVFDAVLKAILTNDETGFTEALNLGLRLNMSKHQLFLVLQKVELWCRMRGLAPLHFNEETALIKLQSMFRMWYVRKSMQNKMALYKNLSMTDSEHYAALAHKYYRVLNNFPL